MRPAERQKVIRDAVQAAESLRDAIAKLGLPTQITRYLTDEELREDIKRLSIDEPAIFVLYQQYRNADLDKILERLADPDRLEQYATPAYITKINSQDAEVTYIVRMLEQYFIDVFGKPLPSTIDRICNIHFPDAGLSLDNIKSKLRKKRCRKF